MYTFGVDLDYFYSSVCIFTLLDPVVCLVRQYRLFKMAIILPSKLTELYPFLCHPYQIQSEKLEWNVESRVGSLDNATHRPKGGEKKVTLLWP